MSSSEQPGQAGRDSSVPAASGRGAQRPEPARLAALADVVLDLAHRLDIRDPQLRDVVPLTGTEIAVVRQIHARPRSTPSQIAEATGLQRSNVSTAVRSLEAGGLVVREQAQGNARSVMLVPTPEAAVSVERIHAFWVDRLGVVADADLAEAVSALEALQRVAVALAGR